MTDIPTGRQVSRHRQTGRGTGRQADRQAGRKTEGRTNKQADWCAYGRTDEVIEVQTAFVYDLSASKAFHILCSYVYSSQRRADGRLSLISSACRNASLYLFSASSPHQFQSVHLIPHPAYSTVQSSDLRPNCPNPQPRHGDEPVGLAHVYLTIFHPR